MLSNLHETLHSSFGLGFWDIPALLVGVVMMIVFVVHKRNHTKRREEFEKTLEEKKKAMETTDSQGMMA